MLFRDATVSCEMLNADVPEITEALTQVRIVWEREFYLALTLSFADSIDRVRTIWIGSLISSRAPSR